MAINALAIATDGIAGGVPHGIAIGGICDWSRHYSQSAQEDASADAGLGHGRGSGEWFIAYPKPKRSVSATVFPPRGAVRPSLARARGAHQASVAVRSPAASPLGVMAVARGRRAPVQCALFPPQAPAASARATVGHLVGLSTKGSHVGVYAASRGHAVAPIVRSRGWASSARAGARASVSCSGLRGIAPDVRASAGVVLRPADLRIVAVDVPETVARGCAYEPPAVVVQTAPHPELTAAPRDPRLRSRPQVAGYAVARAPVVTASVARSHVTQQKPARTRVVIPRIGRT